MVIRQPVGLAGAGTSSATGIRAAVSRMNLGIAHRPPGNCGPLHCALLTVISPRMEHVDPSVLDWLLEGDPAVRWRALALVDAPAVAVGEERARIGQAGWGAEILAHQEADGTWAHNLYHGKWTSTFYTML